MLNSEILQERFEVIKSRLDSVKVSYAQHTFKARCPAHDDHEESIQVTLREEKIGIHCKEKCDHKLILKAIGLDPSFLYPQIVEKVYPYVDLNNQTRHETIKFSPKSFQLRVDKNNWSVENIKLIPYNLPGIAKAIQNKHIIYIVNGEKDAESGINMGLPFTTFASGLDHWQPYYTSYFKNADIIFIKDQSISHLTISRIASKLNSVAKRTRVIALPDLEDKEDFTDWKNKGGNSDQLRILTEQKAESINIDRERNIENIIELVTDINPFIDNLPPEKHWFINDILPTNTVCMLTAAIGTGKTSWLLGLSIAIASGGSFLNHHVQRPGKVLMIQSEASREDIHRRIQQQINYYQEKTDDSREIQLAKTDHIRSNLKFLFTKEISTEILHNELKYNQFFTDLINTDFDLIILDSKYGLFHGDENDHQVIFNFLQKLEQIALSNRTSVVFTHQDKHFTGICKNILSTSVFQDRVNWIFNLSSIDNAVKSKTGFKLPELDNPNDFIYQEVIKKDDGTPPDLGNYILKKEEGGVLIRYL